MKETRVTFPELALIAGTRAAAGVGIGLLLADRLSAEQRKAIGWTLLLVGVATTLPLILEVRGGLVRTEMRNPGADGHASETEFGSWTQEHQRIGDQT